MGSREVGGRHQARGGLVMMEGAKQFLLAPDFIVILLAEPHVSICPP